MEQDQKNNINANTPDAEQNVLDQVMRLLRLTRRSSRNNPRHSHSAARLLHTIAENQGSSSGELADLLDIRPSSLSEMLDRLEERELVERLRDTNDSRIVRVNLSEQGAEQVQRDAEAMQLARAEFGSCFSAEEKQLFCTLCAKLCDHLSEQQQETNDPDRHHQHQHHEHHPDGKHRGRKHRN